VLAHLAREVGCTPGAFRSGRCRDLLAAAAAELGTADGAYLRTEITGRIGGQLWIPRSRTPRPSTWVGCCRPPHG
jgi:hypothetical protein